MGDIVINYGNMVIDNQKKGGMLYLPTQNKICKNNLEIMYTPSHKVYVLKLNLTNNKRIFLTELDEDVLTHLNDISFSTTLVRCGLIPDENAEKEIFASGINIAQKCGYQESAKLDIYGGFQKTLTNVSNYPFYIPPNNKNEKTAATGFVVVDNNYYFHNPAQKTYFEGTYILTFDW